jgi:hypothetical protein
MNMVGKVDYKRIPDGCICNVCSLNACANIKLKSQCHAALLLVDC